MNFAAVVCAMYRCSHVCTEDFFVIYKPREEIAIALCALPRTCGLYLGKITPKGGIPARSNI
eukprot:UN23413